MPSKPTSKAHSLINDELAASSQIASTSPKKCKIRPTVDTNSSDMEIIKSPASPAKKHIKKMPPPPGTKKYNLLPVVLVTCVEHVLFTTLDAILTEGAFSPTVMFGSPKRTVVKTAKATYSDVVKTKLALSVFSIWVLHVIFCTLKTSKEALQLIAHKSHALPSIIPPASEGEHALSELTDSDDNLPDVLQCIML
ncbi:hypothetical protein L208DRAFT_1381131 [Tricholoma matsutake]|nr:hypothetical protein L208DRAFT_1381131 [Tricholoma matsutake 945]